MNYKQRDPRHGRGLHYYLGIRIEDEVFWELPSILYSKRQDILTMTTDFYLVTSSRKHRYLRRHVCCNIMYSSCTERKYTGIPTEHTEFLKDVSSYYQQPGSLSMFSYSYLMVGLLYS